MTATCSKGWGERCPLARGRRCTCACGGQNHGAAWKKADEAVARLELEPQHLRPYRTDHPPVTDVYFNGREAGPGDVTIRYDGDPESYALPHQLVRHSPTGFAWGYGGSGPSDLALNLLLQFVEVETAERLYQEFKWDFIAKLELVDSLTGDAIRAWLQTHTVAV